ncbi:MAG: fluoride efflux transporter FluC [Mycobacterium sp.]
MMWVWVALGAAVGAPLRYLVDKWLNVGHGFPWGTFCVNIVGSLLLALLVGLQVNPTVSQIVGVGFCGALTTYSTFGYEVMREWKSTPLIGVAYALSSLAVGLIAAYAGLLIGRAL